MGLIPYLVEQKENNVFSSPVTENISDTVSTTTNYFNIKSPSAEVSTNGIGLGIVPKSDKILSTVKSAKSDIGNKQIDESLSLEQIVDNLNKSLNLPTTDVSKHSQILTRDSKYYNRFKIANPDAELVKGFPHIFFVSPMCNILTMGSSSLSLHQQFKGNDLFEYIFKTSPNVLYDLSRYNMNKTDFSMLLSNYAKSFSLSDEYINTDTYGRTFTGYKISFGKNTIESKTAGNFDVTFKDTRNLDIYKLHRAWVEYISGVYRGLISPRNEDILFKVLDYTGALYYILTAEDNETILFWSKYYGVYPSTIPSTQYSWGEGNAINKPDISITYQYSWKEDFNPQSLIEFNYNARADNIDFSKGYLPIYDDKLATTGDTYVSRPYIELNKTTDTDTYHYKLRFQK